MQRNINIPSSDRHPFVLAGNLVHLRQVGATLEYRANGHLDDLLHRYFRFDDKTDAIYAGIATKDTCVAALVERYPHLRLRRQPDPWECTVSYICSAHNTLKRLRESVEEIANKLGDPIELDGEVRHTFPSPEMVLARAKGLEGLALGLGKDQKILAAAERVLAGKLDLDHLAKPEVSCASAMYQLMGCHGVGPKIGACIALFSLGKTDAFPVDVRVRNATSKCLGSQAPLPEKEAAAWGARFGEQAGYVNQFLFRSDLDGARAAV